MAVTENIYFFNEYVVHVLAIAFVLHKKYLLEVQKYVENLSSGWGDRFDQHSGFTAFQFIDL